MKTFCTLLASLLLAGGAFGQTKRVVLWDAMPEASYFRVHVGTNAGSYHTNYTVTNLTAFTNTYAVGTYYVAVTAGDTNGLESEFSAEVMFKILPPPKIRVSLQSKKDLGDPWQEEVWFVDLATTDERRFLRTKLDVLY
jgi:hypothetical protein